MSEAIAAPGRLHTEAEAAAVLNIKVATLRRWRWAGSGPAYCKIGAAVRYDAADLAAFIAASRRPVTGPVA